MEESCVATCLLVVTPHGNEVVDEIIWYVRPNECSDICLYYIYKLKMCRWKCQNIYLREHMPIFNQRIYFCQKKNQRIYSLIFEIGCASHCQQICS